MERKIRKTKHQPIDVSQLENLPKQQFQLHSGSFELVEEGKSEEVYKFTKYLAKEGNANPVLNQFGKGAKVYFKYDLRTHDGLMAMNDGDEPKAQFCAQIGNNKTSVLIERLIKLMNAGEESWYKMEHNLMHSQYILPQETNYLFIKIEEIRPLPSLLDPHVEDQKILDKSGQLVIRKTSILQKIQAVEKLKEYTKDYVKIPEADLHHAIALYTRGKFVLGRVTKEEKKDPEYKKKHQMLLSQLHTNCAVFYSKLGQNDKVLGEAKQAIQTCPENPKGHYWLAEGNAQVKKYQEAIASMKRCVEIKQATEPEDIYLPIYRSKIYEWNEAKKQQQRQSVKKSQGFFHKYWDLKEKEEEHAEQRRKEERKAKRLEDLKNQAKEELEELEGRLDALHLEAQLQKGTTELDFS